MLSPEVRAALRREWLSEVEAEIARRASAHADNDNAIWQLIVKLQEMGQRLLTVVISGNPRGPQRSWVWNRNRRTSLVIGQSACTRCGGMELSQKRSTFSKKGGSN